MKRIMSVGKLGELGKRSPILQIPLGNLNLLILSSELPQPKHFIIKLHVVICLCGIEVFDFSVTKISDYTI